MAYNKALDNVIFDTQLDTGLRVQVASYNGGEKKLRISTRTIELKNGGTRVVKAGGLTVDEVKSLADLIPEIEGIMG